MEKLLEYIGTTISYSFACVDDTGAAVDLTGWTVEAKVREALNSADDLFDLSPTIPTPANGTIEIEVAPSVTESLEPGVFQWDLILTTPDGAIIRPVGGPFVLRRTVTITPPAP